jgi:hypothetical protein
MNKDPRTVKLPATMPDGSRTTKHPLLWLYATKLKEPGDNTKLATKLDIAPQTLSKWKARCALDRHFLLPALRAKQIAEYCGVPPSLLRPDVFVVAPK